MWSLSTLTRTVVVPSLALVTLLWLAVVGLGQNGDDKPAFPVGSLFHEGFESSEPSWGEEGGDVKHTIRAHDRSSATAHSGGQSERISLSTGPGRSLYFSHAIGRALVDADLKASVWVKADRPGIQMLARVVFPRERDPDTLKLLGTLIPGSTYDQTGKWQRLDLPRADLATERQARLLRASLKRDIDTREAYVDRIMLNVYAGPGNTEVFIDDLEVFPVESAIRPAGAIIGPPAEQSGPKVEVSQDQLLMDGRPRLLRAIRAPGVSPDTLKQFGFNVVSVEWPLDMAAIQEAVTAQFWLMPQVPSGTGDGRAGQPPLGQVLGELPFRDSVLCWYLGAGVQPEPLTQVEQAVRELRGWTPRRPVAGNVTENFRGYSRELDMIATHRWPIGTALGLREYRDWLTQRRYLARPGMYFFTWVQASGEVGPAGSSAPSRPVESDQIRLLTYSALAAGCRGIGFWADRTLGTPGPGRQRLLEMGLLNLELQLLEPYFAATGSVTTLAVELEPPVTRKGLGAEPNQVGGADFGGRRGFGAGGFAPQPKPNGKQKPRVGGEREEVQATLLRSERGLVVIPVWYGKGAQFVAGQLATNDLTIVIPGIPEAAQAWQVTPAQLRMLKRERVAGGTRLTLPEFDLTGVVIVTSDTGMLLQLQREVAKTASWASLWASELATSELEQVRRVDAQLTALGHAQPDSLALLRSADEHLGVGRSALGRGDYAVCYAETQRARRALRILQRAHWDEAVKGLSAPQASPYATTFASLPEHWRMMAEIGASESGAPLNRNLIAGGDFESAETLAADGWTQRSPAAPGLEFKATLSAEDPHGGSRSLHLQVKPSETEDVPAALDPTLAALVSKPIPVQAGDLVRIRFWLRVPASIEASVDGVTVFDSIGGPQLAISRPDPFPWKQYTLYRRAPRTEQMTVTIGLSGIGDMYVDDLEVQRLPAAGVIAREKGSAAIRR